MGTAFNKLEKSKNKKRKSLRFCVLLYEVINLNKTEKEILFEEKLDALILLKELLIRNGEFHGQEEEEYYQALDRAFELLN